MYTTQLHTQVESHNTDSLCKSLQFYLHCRQRARFETRMSYNTSCPSESRTFLRYFCSSYTHPFTANIISVLNKFSIWYNKFIMVYDVSIHIQIPNIPIFTFHLSISAKKILSLLKCIFGVKYSN
jgi:hypothetical protein